jgi:hypothetical protein
MVANESAGTADMRLGTEAVAAAKLIRFDDASDKAVVATVDLPAIQGRDQCSIYLHLVAEINTWRTDPAIDNGSPLSVKGVATSDVSRDLDVPIAPDPMRTDSSIDAGALQEIDPSVDV